MAHTPEEPAGDDLVAMSDEVVVTVAYTSEGPITHLVSHTTGERIRTPVHMLPHLASLLLTVWQEHEHDDMGQCCWDDDCHCDDPDDWP